jgi:hypothetical protein
MNKVKRIFFTIDVTSRPWTVCEVCNTTIQKQSMRVIIPAYTTKHYFHFECYKPTRQLFIEQRDITNKLSKPEHLDKFNAWLEAWNANFSSSFAPAALALKFTTKVVDSKHSQRHRVWIESLRFLEGREMVKVLPLVCKEFYHISWQNELWKLYVLQEYGLEVDSSLARSIYINNFANQCISCHTLPSEDMYYRCPLLNRVLCKLCQQPSYAYEKYSMLGKSTIELVYNVSPKVLDLKFEEGTFNTRVTYMFLVQAAIAKFAKRNKELLLEELRRRPDASKLTAEIQALDPFASDLLIYSASDGKMVPATSIKERSPAFQAAFDFIVTGKRLKIAVSRIGKGIKELGQIS